MEILTRVFTWWKRQKVLVKLITVFFALIFICCVCSIPISIITPDRTPTSQPVAQDNPTATPIPDTAVPADTPLPTDTTVPTNTPAPTNTPIPELSFTDIVQSPNEKGWTSTQYSTYLDTIKGKYVSGWSGAILEIDEYAGKAYLSLDMKPGEPKIDAYVYISKDDVLKVGLGQNVTFAGTIDSTWPEDNDFYAVQIENVRLLELGEIPPTSTPEPTNTPQPTLSPNDTSASGYVPILGRIWTGVKVYYGKGSDKAYGFEILGGSEDCPSMPSGRGVKVLFPSGSEEWKDRDYLVSSGLFFIREDDPAISAMQWEVYSYCP